MALWGLVSISWTFWLGLIIGIIFILWLIYGGKNYKFIGIDDYNNNFGLTNFFKDKILNQQGKNKPTNKQRGHINLVEPNIPVKPRPIVEEVSPLVTEPISKAEPVETTIDKTPYIPDEVLIKGGIIKPNWIVNESKAQKACRTAAEKYFGKPFVSFWPDWLKNPETDKPLELDIYNDELKIAIEYNGEQHYKYPNKYMHDKNNGLERFIKQIRRDIYKVDACDAHGVYLITVPYNVPEHLMEAYIDYYSPEKVQKRQDAMIADEK